MYCSVVASRYLRCQHLKRHIEHIQNDGLHDSYQSAYWRDDSTETALFKLHSDIAGSTAELVIQLKLSAVFDAVDHTILFKCLVFLWHQGKILILEKSYLSNSAFQLTAEHCQMWIFILTYTREPLQYSMYTKPAGDVIKRCDDDSQVYLTLRAEQNRNNTSHPNNTWGKLGRYILDRFQLYKVFHVWQKSWPYSW